ncbi:bifunctional coenzyme A synthase [Euwallacea similis]|uniref:bifunctional coenzyme A synthase n=1 Tax=Euwallacea similis TaxID=1736056 RepID=UPI00344C72E7
MLVKTGLLVVSNPKHINRLLTDVQKSVKNTLYIQLLSALNDPLGNFHPNIFNTPPKLSRTIFGIYSQASVLCNNLDVRVLLTGLKSNALVHIKTLQPIDVVIFDRKYGKSEIDRFISNKIGNISTEYNVVTIDCGEGDKILAEIDNLDNRVYKHVCLGGTFDRLHVAHKLLLSDSILRASEKVTVGITEENMTHNKVLWELIEDVEARMKNIQDFVVDIFPDLIYNICKIADPCGPAIVDPSIEAIIVSEETIRGAEKINEIRKEKGLGELKIIPIPFIAELNPQGREEAKVSSSNLRLRLLGTLLKPVEKKNIPNKPYIIGLTGGIASGKSGVISHLQNLGVPIIDCDKLGHQMYKKDGPCYNKVVDLFGRKLLDDKAEIDRKILGNLVFKNPDELKKLTNILWPAMGKEIQKMVSNLNTDIVCVEAAVLCQAGWDQFCHEIWVTLVPPAEAINRLKTRNNLSEDQAKERLAAQQSNNEYISKANVVFCPLWEVEYTKLQVHKAWALLQKRIPIKTLDK